MKKVGWLCLAGLAMSASVWAADDWDKIQEKKQIVIGVRDSSPPFGFFDKSKGSVSGYDIEFAQLVAKKLNLTPVFKTVDPADRMPALKDGRVDVLFATFAKTKEREKEVEYSLGYFVSTQKIVAKKGKFHDLLQLDSMTVCVPKGTTNAKYLQDLSQKVQIKQLEDYAEVFKALSEGKCEFASGPEPTLLGNINKMANKADFEVPDVPLAAEVYAVGMRKGQKRLQQQINEALVDAEKSGEAAKIYDNWFGPKSPVPLMRTFKITQ
ncbi:polar amino acid transport system substrate-binding protein [Chitinivorax tropicus]|uniref:Polar amino acid transport system substrate-binding protein n=1 Tax=Chitinivorax tropicus TaxID=714531 RepID=A0A840MF20_9PROT|nr:transporter substrate-binding domain-containing protein [Chitinivorax tropicus]MBB5016990.1 polar amino acid transport system substrate-binding protein [Chitinivorax tropicus]